MINLITAEDLSFVTRLNALHYKTKGMKATVPELEIKRLLSIRKQLLKISNFYRDKYGSEYGAFGSEMSSGNPVGRNGKLHRVWAGIYKGSENKQYAAQISFVINTTNQCLDVGFYFGRASAIQLSKQKRRAFEAELLAIGAKLSGEINTKEELRKRYYELFELGFTAEIKDVVVTPEEWLNNASQDPQFSSVTIGVYPNSIGYIDMETIDFYVSMVLPLVGVVPERIRAPLSENKKRKYALTPEQWAKRAEKLALIGREGEMHVLECERKRLAAANISTAVFPYHTALEDDSAGYDILTCGLQGEKIYIEVKTTTMPRNHPWGKTFFLSYKEYLFYQANREKYKLYRVWDIYKEPLIEEINLENVEMQTDGYMVAIL